MTPDRLQQIQDLYHAAREASSDERAALLERADRELRLEVESLLACRDERLILDRSAQFPDNPTLTVLSAGALLGPYQVESKLGDGGMGEVFRAVDTRLGRPVAIKFVHQRFSARFDREARAISSLNHPNICTLYDIGPDYLVMELLAGDTLAVRLKQGPLPRELALRYAAQILAALGEAHENGIVHRDLKPGNIMVGKSGVKVLDFGLATWEGDESVTRTGMVIGTPAYMAPEQQEGKLADARTDLYSFGCVLYEMLTGVRATPQRKPVPSKALERIVSRCLATEPAKRWQTAVELAAAIDASPLPGKQWRRIVVPAAVLAIILLCAWLFLHPTRKLTDRDTVVLADFVNNTNDAIFDGTLRQGLAFQLEQSPFLKIMDDDQVQSVLSLMRLPAGSRITNRIAHDVCVRQGAAATVDGAIAKFGKNFVITLQAVTCQGGETLAREQIQAEDKEHVLSALGSAVTEMRRKLGESLNSVRALNRPLEQATTSSLEALQSYSAGVSEMSQGQFLAAVPLLERAVALDPNFAMAYAYLDTAYDNAGDLPKRFEFGRKAFGLIDRVSEIERYNIASSYYEETGELDKAIDAYQSGVRGYPRNWIFHNNLSTLLIDVGRYEEGLVEGLEANRLESNVEPPYRRLLDTYLCLDRVSDARKVMETLRARGLGEYRIHQRFLEIGYAEDDEALVGRETQWFAGKPGEYVSLGLQAAYRNSAGQRSESHKLYRRAAEVASRIGLHDYASELEEADAQADALLGNCGTARRLGRPALALALCGDAAQAEKLAAEASRLSPNGMIWNAVQLPEIRAAIALHRDRPAESVDLLASSAPYERAYLEAIYLRGLAYLRLSKGAQAAAEFQKILDHKGANWASAWRHPYWGQFYSLSFLGAARGSALALDTSKARRSFQAFLELWKDADHDIPILQQAKAEYAKLP